MTRVNLDKLTVGHSSLTDNFYVGIAKGNKWIAKKEITNEFIACVISRWKGYREKLTDDKGSVFEISVKEIKK